MGRKNEEKDLCLDEIYNSKDPKIKRFMMRATEEEMEKAHERVTIRMAWEFKSLLPPNMQALLERKYPKEQVMIA